MINYKHALSNPEKTVQQLLQRGFTFDPDKLSSLDHQRSELIQKIELLRKERNEGSEEIGRINNDKSNNEATRNKLISRMQEIGSSIKEFETELSNIEDQLQLKLQVIPNIPAENAPIGKDDTDNELIHTWGEKPIFDFIPKSHVELGEATGITDFQRATKIAGARFSLLKGAGARLEQACRNFMFDLAVTENGYIPMSVPYMVNQKTMTGTGQLPKFQEELFSTSLGDREYYLIPTGEVPVTNIHAEEILLESILPIKYCSITPCFRSEAGSAGRDVKGLIRQHQFEKLEMVCFTKPDDSWNQLEKLREHAEKVLQRLGLHYRVVALCTGDLPFASMYTYDLEVWLPSQNTYREISSCSNCGSFQARRANIRFKNKTTNQKSFVHTLNGSGMPLGRTVVAIMEQYQRADGSILIPEVLQHYTGFERILPNGNVQ
ncbi:serine--tRNA ligase [Bacillus velezensis]|uniref:serine--tRNA ligase n=1 Tax=Bacillus velezensis TaxID=492670 RepID=UPI000DC5D2D9|nr:serine--tRNA ligase [Bacillus velezensis]MED3509506.1 serine--tRNA ligase [Bacillus velezensis]RAP15252.1 Seryl-tRNA synthetase [Bacillus velezensis]